MPKKTPPAATPKPAAKLEKAAVTLKAASAKLNTAASAVSKASIPPLRQQLIGLIQDPEKQRSYRQRGKAAVPGGHNACAATASQPFAFDLGILHGRINTFAEGLATDMKRTRLFLATDDLSTAQEGDLVVCMDKNKTKGSDHVWLIVRVLGGGWFECLDNQLDNRNKLSPHTYRRRLDGDDGKTPARGLLRLTH